jgi:hypothetical protein|tara:strand:+ start:93 stop:398 length:306 start_codon:yes stop_codon:yes gene_type:complete
MAKSFLVQTIYLSLHITKKQKQIIMTIISDKNLLEALNGLDQSYNRLSCSGKDALDKFFTRVEAGVKQTDLNEFLKGIKFDYDRMNVSAQESFKVLKNAKI